jgi:hypothetical protein
VLLMRDYSRPGRFYIGNIDLSVFNDDNLAPDKFYSYCVGVISLYEETLKLPKKDAATLVRYFVVLK